MWFILYHYNETDTSYKRLMKNAIELKKSINEKFCLEIVKNKAASLCEYKQFWCKPYSLNIWG